MLELNHKQKLVAFTVVGGGFALVFLWKLLPVFAPTLFLGGTDPYAQLAAASSAPTPGGAPAPRPASDGGDSTSDSDVDTSANAEMLAQHKLDDIGPELTDAKVAADPVGTLRKVWHIGSDYPETTAGRKAKEIGAQLRQKYSNEVMTADKAAQEDLARFKKDSADRLAAFDNIAVAEDWHKLASKYAGLIAGDTARKERKQVLDDWRKVPPEEKKAASRLADIPKSATDYEGMKTSALAVNGVALTCSSAKVSASATALRDSYSAKLAALLEADLAEHPETVLERAMAFPDELRGPVADRVASVLKRATEETNKRAAVTRSQIHELRGKGDFAGARVLIEKLPSVLAEDERTACLVHETARGNRIKVDGGAFTSGPEKQAVQSEVKTFWIGKLEVTNREYLAFVRETGAPAPRDWVNGLPDSEKEYALPVAGIDQAQAAAFAQWLGGRLPTALEWERAARGTDGRPFPWGKKWNKDVLASPQLKPPGSFPDGASPAGALDMAGNVAEWTATTDDKGNVAVKGGSCRDATPEAFHMGAVVWTEPGKKHGALGFRCAWDYQE
jgi:formylglycine-generating enzyme required for sulfatase activity